MSSADLDPATVNEKFDESINKLSEGHKRFIADICEILTEYPSMERIWIESKENSMEKITHFFYIMLTSNINMKTIFSDIWEFFKKDFLKLFRKYKPGIYDVFRLMSTKLNKVIFFDSKKGFEMITVYVFLDNFLISNSYLTFFHIFSI